MRNWGKQDLPPLDFNNFPELESYTFIMKINSVKFISEAVKVRRKQLALTQSETVAMCNVGARFFF